MKYITLITICACAITLSSCLHRHHDTSISVRESADRYRFTAYFPENKTGKVQKLITRSLSLDSFFGSPNDYADAITILEDKTRVAIKASPGELIIKLDKEENTVASYHRIKKMCEEIKNTLKE